MSRDERTGEELAAGVSRRRFVQGLGVTAIGSSMALPGRALATSGDGLDAARAAGHLGPRQIRQIETVWIEMSDGTKIAARILLPADADTNPVPAIMEYYPYRRRDGTRIGDDHNLYYLASHGYACIRPDIRGSGDSEGVLKDEYLKQEQDDGLEIIAWLAKQPWCTGRVGMSGMSWGGISALQVAARRPPALKAIITHCSCDDRYTDDAHYLGGAIVADMFLWGSDFYTLQAFPPDAAVVGARWRDMWRARCESIDFAVANWVRHQTRDAFWKHGSVDENYADIICPVYATGGWADGYPNAIARLMEHLTVPRKALIGPWAHNFPYQGQPGPTIDYLNESRRWWDHWLKDVDTGIMKEPMLRAWLQDEPSHRGTDQIPGRWVAEETWPSPRIRPETWHLNEGSLDRDAKPGAALVFGPTHQTVGLTGGHWCPGGSGVAGELVTELPLEQGLDDGRSLLFDSAPLVEPLEVLGFPVIELDLSVDKPVALVAVRLNEVKPDGRSLRLSYGVLNLTHRDGHEHPEELEPGKRYKVSLKLKHAGFSIKPGSRLRVAISTSYWPMVWPSPEPVTLTLYAGASTLSLPVRPDRPEDAQLPPFGAGFVPPDSGFTVIKPSMVPTKDFDWDIGSGTLTITSQDGGGVGRFDAIGTIVSGNWREVSHIRDDDPLSAQVTGTQVAEFKRDDWHVRIETTIEVSVTRQDYVLTGTVKTFDHDKPFFDRVWKESVPRLLS